MKYKKCLALLLCAALLGTMMPSAVSFAETAEAVGEDVLEDGEENPPAGDDQMEEAEQPAGGENQSAQAEAAQPAGGENQSVQAEAAKPSEEVLQAEPELLSAGEELSSEPDAAASLPQPGDVVHGFTVTEIRDFPLMDATIVQFVHEKTGAELYYIANDDTNRLFDLTFFTKASDNTGLPHVFEHSTLDGSEKYPSKSLFFNLGYQTYQTFMNAMTYKLMTTYPVASLSEEQLLKLADYYTDSCLNPMIMTDESIYREEAWRYRLMDKDADLTIEGTVYSEMLGATDLHRMAETNFFRTIFPGSNVTYDTGGLPEFIPDMTYESLRDYHNKYYTPSNCAAYLYGQFDHYEDFLAVLDEAFAPFEKTVIEDADSGYTPIKGPVMSEYPYGTEEGSDTRNGSDIYYGIICQDVSNEEILVLDNLLTLLLSDEGSPLVQKLQQVLPSGEFSAYLELEGPEPVFVFTASNVERGSDDLFKATVDEVLDDLAQNGFKDEFVEGVAASQRLSNALSRESASVGVDVVVPMFAYNYSVTGDPWYYLECIETIDQVEEYQKDGRIQEVLRKYFEAPERAAVSTTYVEPGLKEQQDAAVAEKLAKVKASMTDEEIEALVEASNMPQEEDSAAEYVAQLSAVTVDSLPEETQMYPISDETGEDGIRRLSVDAPLDGVSYGSIFIDTNAISQEDLLWYSLYTDLYSKLDTEEHTREELASLTSRYLYSLNIFPNAIDNVSTGEFSTYLDIDWIALDEDLEEGYDLAYELLYDLKVDDVQLLSDAVASIQTSLKNEISASPFNVQIFRGFARNSMAYRYMNYMENLDYYAFLGEVETLLQKDPVQVVEKLESIKAQIHNASGAYTIAIGDEESVALRNKFADAFLNKLDNEEREAAVLDLPVPAASEGIILDSSVQYNGYVADYPDLGLDAFHGDLDGVTALVLDMYLYPMLRDAYGVYGILHGAAVRYGSYLITYRDPNLSESYDVIAKLSSLIADEDLDQDTLNGYILSSYSNYALSQGVLTTASQNLDYYLRGFPDDIRITWMRELKELTPEKMKTYADAYAKLVENGYKTSAGGAGVINANADQFEVILNPFGASDNSQVEFTDLPEESEYYEAVRFAFENGMMDPESDEAFGVDSPATAGDLAGGLFVMMGGYPHAQEEAVTTLAQAGLFPADLTADTPLTQEMADNAVNALLAMAGVAAPETEGAGTDAGNPDDPVTRGDLALALYALATME